jgi:uncharacterized repeat protein (TIGR01451 family)
MARFIRTAPLAVLSALLLALALATAASAATYTVDNTSDNYASDCTDAVEDCSLQGALDNANDGATDDTVVVPAGVYHLTSNENDGLYVNKTTGTLTIQGAGAADTVIDADGTSRVLTIEDSIVDVSGVTLRDGNSRSRRFVTPLATFGVQGDRATVNLASTGKTAVLPPSPGIGFPGIPGGLGGIAVQSGGGLRALSSSVTLTDSVVSHNNAGRSGAAGGILNADGTLKLVRTTVHRNNANVAGGGIVNLGVLELEGSTVSDNLGTYLAGGILNLGRVSIDSSTISGNFSEGHGGGLLNVGVGQFVAPTLAGSVGANVSDAPTGDSIVTNSTFSDNVVRFGEGGAVLHVDLGSAGPIPSSVECTPEALIATDPCGTVPGQPAGTTLTLLDDTFADNSFLNSNNKFTIGLPTDWGRGASIYAVGPVDIGNSILTNGNDRGREQSCGAVDPLMIESLGNNIESGDWCPLNEAKNDKIATDVLLGDLRDNGGPTKTRALRAGSPAINSYEGDQCAAVDQRGGARPPEDGSAGSKCDAGAYEANSLGDLSVDSHTDAPDPATVGQPLTYSIVVRNAGPDAIQGVKVADALPAGTEVVSAPDWNLGTLAAGDTRTLQVIVRPTAPGDLTATATVSAPGMTDTKPSNDSAPATTHVNAAPQQQQQQTTPPPNNPQQQDGTVNLTLNVPTNATVDEFFDGITVEADCKDEPCLRRFREHAAINTGATRIAGFNLTVSRTFLPLGSKKTVVKLRPCLSGSKTGKPHRRCLSNLRKAVKKAGKFKVKVVVVATDAAGNAVAKKAYITIAPKRK